MSDKSSKNVFQPGDVVYLLSKEEAEKKLGRLMFNADAILEKLGGKTYKIFSMTDKGKYRLDACPEYAFPDLYFDLPIHDNKISEKAFLELIERRD